MKRVLAIVLLLIFSGCSAQKMIPAHARVHTASWQDSQAVEKLFRDAGVRGTFVLYDVAGDRFIGHHRARAQTRFRPASTFKILNSLIGLGTGAVADVDEVLPYGGEPQPIRAWERDMGLREAIPISNVPIYQELARRIGLERMRRGVARLGYGNEEIGAVVDRFWLDGPLKISAVEQARFLACLAQSALPLPETVQAQVREIVELDRGEGWALYGKTGWAVSQNPDEPGIGWWVGWVRQGEHVYSFAINIDMDRMEDAPKRLELGQASLRALGVLRHAPPAQ